MKIADGVYVAKDGKLYKVHGDCKCDWSTCAFYKPGACDSEGSIDLPCAWIDKMLRENGAEPNGANYLEVYDDEEGEDEES